MPMLHHVIRLEHASTCDVGGRSSCARRAARRCRPNPVILFAQRWFPHISPAEHWQEREACETQHSEACERVERPQCQQHAQEYCAAAYIGPIMTDKDRVAA